jgi:galactokinase
MVARSFVAPGRVNLMGDHTDYNDGFVLPLAIGQACSVMATPNPDAVVRARSAQLPGHVAIGIGGGAVDPRSVEPPWGRFVAGAVQVLADRGVELAGVDLEVSSAVPVGSGLSSSSALTVGLVLALADRAGVELERVDAARLARAAEVAATGVPGGLMDQLASLFGRADHALLIDCRGPLVTPVPIGPQLAVVVVHSGMSRTLSGSAYAERRAECEASARRIGVATLRDASADAVVDDPRARHVITENARVLATAAALPTGDLSVLGPLLLASHASLRDDFAVSTPELDVLVELLVDSGAAGARLTGAGFGGCVVALAQRNHADDIVAKAVLRYHEATGLDAAAFVARAVDGARGDE